MKILCILCSSRKKHSWTAADRFLDQVAAQTGAKTEIIRLADYRIEPCIGCIRCFDHGEEHCPLTDDRDVLLGKIERADGLVIATPNYSFHIPGNLKVLLDRMGYIFHLPDSAGTDDVSHVPFGYSPQPRP